MRRRAARAVEPDPGGFNPRQSAERQAGAGTGSKAIHRAQHPTAYFRGEWTGKHPLNVPGPFYGAETDTCCCGPAQAPSSLLYDEDGQEFVWRQPRDDDETYALMRGASSDPFDGYSWDGDEHWTPDLVRDWWNQRRERQGRIDEIVRVVAGPRPELPTEWADLLFRARPVGGYADDERALMRSIVADYLAYLADGVAHDLRRYIYFLEQGCYPGEADHLPAL